MSIRSVCLASVCAALLAAGAAVCGASAAPSTAAREAAVKGYKALAGGHPEEAIIQYTQAIDSRELDPADLAMALLNRALARQGLKQMSEAINDYSAALRVDALSPKLRAVALYNRGLAHQAMQKRPQAIEDFTGALYLDPKLPQAFHARANALRESGQYLFALSDYAKARRLNHPQPHVPVYGEALTYEALGRPAETRKALEEALALMPDFAPARERLAKLDAAGAAAPTPRIAAGEPAFTPVTSGRDPVVTGAIDGQNQAVTRLDMPQAVAPPAILFAGAAPVPQTVTHAPPTRRCRPMRPPPQSPRRRSRRPRPGRENRPAGPCRCRRSVTSRRRGAYGGSSRRATAVSSATARPWWCAPISAQGACSIASGSTRFPTSRTRPRCASG